MRVRVSSADLTPLQIAESQAGCLGQWICEDSFGFVEFDSQEDADRVLVAAFWSDRMEVTEAQADACFRLAEAAPPGTPEERRALTARVLAKLGFVD
jgi:hypothetical protein